MFGETIFFRPPFLCSLPKVVVFSVRGRPDPPPPLVEVEEPLLLLSVTDPLPYPPVDRSAKGVDLALERERAQGTE